MWSDKDVQWLVEGQTPTWCLVSDPPLEILNNAVFITLPPAFFFPAEQEELLWSHEKEINISVGV